MRIKNKEIRARRHRKEDKIKDAARELRAQFGDGKSGEKPAPKAKAPAAKAAKPAAKKPEAPKAAAAKKPAAPKAKKADSPAE